MSKRARALFFRFFVLAILAAQPALALDEINYLHLKVEAQNRVDFASAEFAGRLSRGVVPVGAQFGTIRIGGGLALSAQGGLTLAPGPGRVQVRPFQVKPQRPRMRLTAIAEGAAPGVYGMGKAPIAFLFSQGVCAVGFEVSYYHSAEQKGQLPANRRFEIRVTAHDWAGSIIGEYVRYPARGTTRQAFAVPTGAPPIAAIEFSSTAPEGFGLGTLLAKPCALLMM